MPFSLHGHHTHLDERAVGGVAQDDVQHLAISGLEHFDIRLRLLDLEGQQAVVVVGA